MPTYFLKYTNLTINKNIKQKIAKTITKIHKKNTGANSFFAQVLFEKNNSKNHFMGGKLVKTSEIFIFGNIRGGRTSKVKQNMIIEFRNEVSKILRISRDKVWIYLADLHYNQMMEYGEILPKAGKEKEWLNSLSKSLKKKLKKIGY